jgi:V8-like Glu-specific endopeptidase
MIKPRVMLTAYHCVDEMLNKFNVIYECDNIYDLACSFANIAFVGRVQQSDLSVTILDRSINHSFALFTSSTLIEDELVYVMGYGSNGQLMGNFVRVYSKAPSKFMTNFTYKGMAEEGDSGGPVYSFKDSGFLMLSGITITEKVFSENGVVQFRGLVHEDINYFADDIYKTYNKVKGFFDLE